MVRAPKLLTMRLLDPKLILHRLHDKRVPIEGPYPCVTPADVQNYGNNIQDGNYERHVLHAPPGLVDELTVFLLLGQSLSS